MDSLCQLEKGEREKIEMDLQRKWSKSKLVPSMKRNEKYVDWQQRWKERIDWKVQPKAEIIQNVKKEKNESENEDDKESERRMIDWKD